MKKLEILGAVVTVLAICAIAVASASATLWLEAGKSLTTEKAGAWHGTVVFEKLGGSAGNSKMECSLLWIIITGSGPKGRAIEVSNLTGTEKNLIKCKTLEGCFVTEPTVHVIHLPWTTELVLEGGATWDKQKGTGGEPGYEVECIFGVKVTCSVAEKAKFTGNGANGAEFSYLGAESGESTCSDGGKGFLKGTKITGLGYTVS